LHGLSAAVRAHAFEELRISVSLWMVGLEWFPIHLVERASRFEDEYGVTARRWAYDGQSWERVRETKRTVLGELSGLHDLFVPVFDGAEVRGHLVSGPFAVGRPTSADLLERWHGITGAHGRVSDPRFADFISATLSTLTLEGRSLTAFERLVTCFAGLLTDADDSDALASEAEALQRELGETRFPEHMWDVARDMVDDRASRNFASHAGPTLREMSMDATPEHVVVGLLRGRDDEPDPIDEMIRSDAFQRSATLLARRIGGVVCGKVGDHGVVFLMEHGGARARTQRALADLSTRAATEARRFGFKLHAGIAQGGDATLPIRYRTALFSAEKALSQGVGVVYGEPQREGSAELLRDLRAELAQSIAEPPSALARRFDRYIEAVLLRSGYRMELARGQLDAGLERLVEPLCATGTLDRKSAAELLQATATAADSARTVTELVDSYRRLISDIAGTLRDPLEARQDRGARRALAFMQERFAESITIAQVAKVAGFAPDYFCRIFKRDEGATPEEYLKRLRLERAKQLLTSTTLKLDSVCRLSGFRNKSYFHRAFHGATGVTPMQYRLRS
jgi:AraC-like DNA-binding protein